MAELIQETKDYIEALGYSKEDIQWIGGHDFTIPIDCFWKAAPQVYDAGYGSQEVAMDLVIVFKDGSWLERQEYDGSEWWAYKRCPNMPLRIESVKRFVGMYDSTLARINGIK
jgi:hypothetical protein